MQAGGVIMASCEESSLELWSPKIQVAKGLGAGALETPKGSWDVGALRATSGDEPSCLLRDSYLGI